jgi:ketosteroid isomerase-like protein
VPSVDLPRETYVDLSLSQVADRLAIRDLVDAYPSCADRRDATGQMALFTEDTEYEVYEDPHKSAPTQRFRGRAALAPVFDDLKNYAATMHFNGQSTVVLDGGQASAVTYCLAHLVKGDGSARNMMIASIRYLDTFVKDDGVWLISQRKAMVDGTETRSLPTAVGV